MVTFGLSRKVWVITRCPNEKKGRENSMNQKSLWQEGHDTVEPKTEQGGGRHEQGGWWVCLC